jgi:hypothetical protein
LLGDFNIKVGREDISKPIIFIMIKGLVQYMQHEKSLKSEMFPHCKILIAFGLLLMGTDAIRLIMSS